MCQFFSIAKAPKVTYVSLYSCYKEKTQLINQLLLKVLAECHIFNILLHSCFLPLPLKCSHLYFVYFCMLAKLQLLTEIFKWLSYYILIFLEVYFFPLYNIVFLKYTHVVTSVFGSSFYCSITYCVVITQVVFHIVDGNSGLFVFLNSLAIMNSIGLLIHVFKLTC